MLLAAEPAKSSTGETLPRSRPISAPQHPTSSYPLRAESDSQLHVHFTDRGIHRLGLHDMREAMTSLPVEYSQLPILLTGRPCTPRSISSRSSSWPRCCARPPARKASHFPNRQEKSHEKHFPMRDKKIMKLIVGVPTLFGHTYRPGRRGARAQGDPVRVRPEPAERQRAAAGAVVRHVTAGPPLPEGE